MLRYVQKNTSFQPGSIVQAQLFIGIQRWVVYLSNFDYDLIRIKVINNISADCLLSVMSASGKEEDGSYLQLLTKCTNLLIDSSIITINFSKN